MRIRNALLSAAAFAAVALAAACEDGSLTPAAQQAIKIACNVDALAQPVAVTLAPSVAPGLAPIAATDQALVHPAVVAACKAVNGTPAAVTVTAPAASPAPAPVTVSPAPTAPAKTQSAPASPVNG